MLCKFTWSITVTKKNPYLSPMDSYVRNMAISPLKSNLQAPFDHSKSYQIYSPAIQQLVCLNQA